MILRTPMTTNTPTPKAIPPTRIIALSGPEIIVTCFETIMILGSAHVISKPKVNEKRMTIKRFFCLERDAPMYSPTLASEDEAPIWNKARPVIKAIIPMRMSQILELSVPLVILAIPLK